MVISSIAGVKADIVCPAVIEILVIVPSCGAIMSMLLYVPCAICNAPCVLSIWACAVAISSGRAATCKFVRLAFACVSNAFAFAIVCAYYNTA